MRQQNEHNFLRNRWEWFVDEQREWGAADGRCEWVGAEIGKGEGEGGATEIMELNDINTFARYQIAFACRMDGFTLHSSLSTPVSLTLSLLLSLFLFPSHCRACLLLQYFLCRAVFLLLLLFFCFAGHGHKTSAIFKRCTWAVWFVVMPAWKTPSSPLPHTTHCPHPTSPRATQLPFES